MINNVIETINGVSAEKVAYDYLGQTYTYGELKQLSDNLAIKISKLDVPRETPILVYGGQDFNMVVSFMASVKAGHAYIPVDVESPIDRIESILEIGKPGIVIANEPLPENINPDLLNIPIINKEVVETLDEDLNDVSKLEAVSGDENYYIIFTSGTTGKPKGVQISHNNLLNFVNWMLSDEFNLPKTASYLAQPAFSFDLSVMSWVMGLVTGNKVVSLPKKISDSFKDLFTVLPEMDINIWVSTPSFAKICLLNEDFNEENFAQLKTFLFCGEELPLVVAKQLNERFPNARIFNTYGPTEATVAVTSQLITEKELSADARLPIGKANGVVDIVIMDKDSHEVLPVNEKGEIVIVGKSVSKGYLNNPEKTKQAFFEYNNQAAYRTGDLGSIDEEGTLHYGGRLDFQIKLHGYRIELEEVSHHVNKVPSVKQGVAVPKYDKKTGAVSQLLAYVVPQETELQGLALTKQIKAELENEIMPYMMPSRFVYVDELPINQNGKVDIKKLIAEVNS